MHEKTYCAFTILQINMIYIYPCYTCNKYMILQKPVPLKPFSY